MEPKLVKMFRDSPLFPGGPITADVHPAEVAGWASFGWQTVPEGPEKEPVEKAKLKGKKVLDDLI